MTVSNIDPYDCMRSQKQHLHAWPYLNYVYIPDKAPSYMLGRQPSVWHLTMRLGAVFLVCLKRLTYSCYISIWCGITMRYQ